MPFPLPLPIHICYMPPAGTASHAVKTAEAGKMNCWQKCAALVLASIFAAGLIHLPQVAIGQSPLTSQQLDELFEKARPRLEEALGEKLAITPRFQTIPSKYILATADADLEAFLHWHSPNLEGQTSIHTRSAIRQIVGKATIALHDERMNVILVPAENLAGMSSWDEDLAKVNSNQFLQLALVHEVVRLHVDKRFQLSKLRAACRDAE